MITRTICHIWGPFFIYSYGVMIAFGCIATYYLILKDPRRATLISENDLAEIFSLSIIVGILGGRLLHLCTSYDELTTFVQICSIHEGGFSILGAVIALLIFIPCYMKAKHIPILPALDVAGIYTPFLQAIARLGCFFAGCCFGAPSNLPWAIRYTHEDTLAPLYCWLHPTQLYSSLSFFAIFLFLYTWAQHHMTRPGQLISLSILLSSFSRFIIDFWRNDREFVVATNNVLLTFSIHQWIALCLMVGTSVLLFILHKKRRYSL